MGQKIRAWARNSIVSFLLTIFFGTVTLVTAGGWAYDEFLKEPKIVAPSKEEIADELLRKLPPPPLKREVEKEPQENLKTEAKPKVEVHRRPDQAQKNPDSSDNPDIHLALVYPKSFAVVLYNSSNVLLEKPKYAPGIWNLDRPDNSGNVPTLMIPVFEGDWIRPHESMGPENVFDTALVKTAVQPGDRLFGFMIVTCPACITTRQYWVYAVFDHGGWYCELPEGQSILLDKLAAAIPSYRTDPAFQDKLICGGDRKQIKMPSETTLVSLNRRVAGTIATKTFLGGASFCGFCKGCGFGPALFAKWEC